MTFWKSPSLRIQLTWRMAALQAAVLLGFVMVAAIPFTWLLAGKQGLDVTVFEDIARDLRHNNGGELIGSNGGALEEALRKYHNLWFYAVDAQSRVGRHGPITPAVSGLVPELERLNSGYLPDIGPEGAREAVVRRIDGSDGSIWIIGGGGPEMRLRTALAVLGNPIFLALLFCLTGASFLYSPILIRRQLQGLERIAEEADMIDVDQRGVRLSSEHAPQELHSLVSAVNAALQRLDEGIERRHRFLADAAHELRTPIAILQTRIELLPDNDERGRLLLGVSRLTNLANQLLDLQRLDADVARFQPIDLVGLAAQVTSDMAPLAIAAGDEIAFDAEVDRVTISGDPGSLARALTNLIQNAVIHGGQKTVIRVGVGRDGALRVADSGPGIAEHHRATIFEPFRRIVPLDQGAGLGLSLVRDIVQRHNGRIVVGDSPSGGALFEISLPVVSSARR